MFLQDIIKSKWLIPALFLGVVLIVFFEFQYRDKFYPGVYIAGVSVGGRNYNEVLEEFEAKAEILDKDGVDVVFKRENGAETLVNVPGATLGLTSDIVVEYFSIRDVEGEVINAYNWGRNGNAFRKARQQIQLIIGKNFNSAISVHDEAVRSLISREINVFASPMPAQFSFSDGKVTISKEVPGDSIDMEEVIEAVRNRANSFDTKPVVSKVKLEIPEVTEQKLRPFLGLVGELAKSANVNFYYKTRKWQVKGITLITWLTLKSGDIIKQNDILAIDEEKLETFLSKSVVPLVNDPPQNSRFEMKDGKLTEISPGKSGNVVNIEKTIETIEKIIPHFEGSYFSTAGTGAISSPLVIDNSKINFNTKDNTIDVQIEIIKVEPRITQKTVDQYNIKDLVGYAETSFAGSSADRKHNIRNGVSKLTGLLIAPGERFSMVGALGPVTEKEGFVKEFVIREVRNVKELGGGLCQLATTFFNTILNAALPVTERANHRYTIKYYVTGLDATIYGPHPDLRFINDTGNWLLLQGKVFGDKVAFELYGVADGRIAEVSKPVLSNPVPVPETRYVVTDEVAKGETKCTDSSKQGITADATYTITYPDGAVKQQKFHSVYEAWPRVCLVGPS